MDVNVSTAEKRAAAIRKAVRAIKRGSFLSYGDVARRAGLPGRARLVGQVLRESGDSRSLPWHRVTGAGGRNRPGLAAELQQTANGANRESDEALESGASVVDSAD